MEIAQAMSFPCYFIFTSLQVPVVVSFHIRPSMQNPIPLPHLQYARIYSIFLSPYLLAGGGDGHFLLSFFASSFLLSP